MFQNMLFPYEQLDEQSRHKYCLKLYEKKRISIIAVACIIVIFEIGMIITLLLSGGATTSETRRTFFSMYSLLLAVTVLCILLERLCHLYFLKQPKRFLHLVYIYSLIVCYWASFISAFSHRSAEHSGNISVYLYVSIFVSVLVPMRTGQSLFLFLSNWLFFGLQLRRLSATDSYLFSSLVNSLIVAILSIYLTITMQQTQIRDFLNAETILHQNEKIGAMNQQLSVMVVEDELTEIHNRRFMQNEFPPLLKKAREQGQSVAMLMMDVDNFKLYNDFYGHQAGDECLYQIAKAVSSCIEQKDSYFVRYGGEEFLLFLIDISKEELQILTEKIRKTVEQLQIPHEHSPFGYITVSLGVCFSPKDSNATVNQLVHYADSAMYEAKNEGRNQVAYFLEKK